MNMFGESIKLQGHISFPLTLNMSSFQNRVEIEHSEPKLSVGSRLVQQSQQPIRYSDIIKLQNDQLGHLYKQPSSLVYLGGEIQEEQTTTQDGKVHDTWTVTANGNHTYKLASVVEHFGNAGSGHYTVYRRVGSKTSNPETDTCWVGVSDSQVYRVLEEDVLSAGATLLFYERVSES